ncbi:MAG TPA: DUF6206 family protein [Solirubrobacterales bacterium]|nr:DUF6206 family protein [Solirubrobacterales bacterium]
MTGHGEGPSPGDLTEEDLRSLDDLVTDALSSGNEQRLPVLGYGEISLVLGWPPEGFRFACKRLPPFRSRAQFDAYRETLRDYVSALESAGVRVVDTELRAVERDDGGIAGYVVQPMLPTDQLAPALLRQAAPEPGHPLVDAVASTVAAVVSPSLGLDAQLANWTWDGERLTYFDVSTPLIWSPEGRSRLDLDLIVQAYPAMLRWHLRRFVAPGILDTYRNLRKAYLDLSGNLLKERLDGWLPRFLERANTHLTEPLDEDEVRRYYRSDARLWGALLRIRRVDRAWRRRVRRRPYPFLLPGRIER